MKKLILIVMSVFAPALIVSADTVEVNSGENIQKVLRDAEKGDVVIVDEGIYTGSFTVPPHINLVSKTLFGAILYSKSKSKFVVNLTNHSSVEGFEIRGAKVGVISSNKNNSVKKCFIYRNHESGIMCTGVIPEISDNIIVYNGGSGITGWNIRSITGDINHNTIAYNKNHGINIHGESDITIQNCIIAFNDRFSINTGYEVELKADKNLIYSITENNISLPEGNIWTKPEFKEPDNFNFTLVDYPGNNKPREEYNEYGARVNY